MNSHTLRDSTPDLAGCGESALPKSRRQTVPFAIIPHDVAADPRLSPTDLRVLAALLYYARQDPSCYPSDASLAARVHRHPGTVRRCLKRLEDLGYIRREFVQATPANPTGRTIYLVFTDPDWPRPAEGRGTRDEEREERGEWQPPERRCTPTPERRCSDPPSAAARTPRAPAHTDVRIPEETERNVTNFKSQQRPLTTPPEPRLGTAQVPPTPPQIAAQSTPPHNTPTPTPAPTPARPLKEELKSLPGVGPDHVRSIAWRLAHHLTDVASVGFFVMCLTLVASGAAPVERALAAFVAADRSRGKAQKPGAIWAVTWAGWQLPPLPSTINRPVYYQAHTPTPTPPPGGDELSREAEIIELRAILDRPNGPFARVARARLAELGASPDS